MISLVYNIAAPNDNPTYEELRLAMGRAQGRTEQIEYKPGTPGEPNRWDTDSYVLLENFPFGRIESRTSVSLLFRIINPAKIINELGWKPRHVGFVEEIDLHYKAWAAHKAVSKVGQKS